MISLASGPSPGSGVIAALWYAHTWAAEHFYITPRLVLSSAEPGSGKTRVLEVSRHLVRTPEMTFSATPAALFRMVGAGPLTILFDEVDAIFDSKGGGNEDLRALVVDRLRAVVATGARATAGAPR